MLPGLGGSELIVIAIVALVVVGPKDLPKLLRNLGKFIGKMRNMADDFKSSFDDMARQSELDDLRKEVEALRSGNIATSIQNDMKAIESDVRHSLSKSDSPVVAMPPADPELADPSSADPQLDGLPPKWDAGTVETAELEPVPQTVAPPAKKPRVRKPKVAAEPEVEPDATPVKRSRRKAAS